MKLQKLRPILHIAVVTSLLALASYFVRSQAIWAFILFVPLMSLPCALVISSLQGLRRGHWLAQVSSGSFLRTVLAGGGVRIFLSAAISIALTIIALPQLLTLSIEGWALFALTMGLFSIIRELVQGRGSHHFLLPFAIYWPIKVAMVLTPFVALLCSLISIRLALPILPTLQEVNTGSDLVYEIVEMGIRINNAKFSMIERVSPDNAVLLGALLGTGAGAAFAAGWAAFLSLPFAEWRRGLAPASTEPVPARIGAVRIGFVIFFATFLLVFVWGKSILWVETVLMALPTAERPVARADAAIKKLVDMVDGKTVEPGTVARIKEVNEKAIASLSIDAKQAAAVAIDTSAERMIANTDKFLDEYYSLKAEYLRLASLLTGELETQLTADMTSILSEGLSTATWNGNAVMRAAFVQADFEIARIIDESRVTLANNETPEVAESCETFNCRLGDTAQTEIHALERRLASAGMAATGGSAAGAAIGSVVAKKMVAKGAIKVAAKSMAKVAMSKAAGGGLGAMVGGFAGGVIGSIVPGAGTTAGAVGGAAVGALAFGVGADALMLELEEEFGRADFEKQINDGINEWRSAGHAALAEID